MAEAVTGLPKAQEDHAVQMVKFSIECMAKLNEMTAEFVSSLGEDTAYLKLRIGLHARRVTGGVLRGDKT